MALFCSFQALGQNSDVVVNSLPNAIYQVSMTNLGPEDLVFYRFSDGFDMTAIATSTNTGAAIQRSFKNAQIKVSALVARKNGPIGIATGEIGNSGCGTCQLPYVGLQSWENIRIRETSWSPFVDPANPMILQDDKTVPFCYTPNTPWFILPITMKAAHPYDFANIDIPSNMTIKGAIVKNIYKQINLSPDLYTVSDPDVRGFLYNVPSRIRINLNASYGGEFTVYLIVSSTTIEGENSNFGAQMYGQSGNAFGNHSDLKVITNHNPHDPNHLVTFQPTMCGYSTHNPPVTYRVDFQNLGQGKAEIVKVRIEVNTNMIDPYSLTSQGIVSSFPVSSFTIEQNAVILTFNGINLAGLAQVPVPPMNSTEGWVEVTLQPRACGNVYGGKFNTNAFVTFIGNNGTFTETIPTNTIAQYLSDMCAIDDMCPHLKPGHTSTTLTGEPFISKVYPTLFDNVLHLEAPATEENSRMTVLVTDLTGRLWMNREFQLNAHEFMREDLETTQFPSGMYMVQFVQGSDVTVFKVIKE